jgi:hypothetical protein
MERASVYEKAKIGIQSTAAAVIANLQLASFGILPKPVQPSEMLKARGSKIATFTRRQKGAHTIGTITGYMAYNDLIPLLYSSAGVPTVTPVGGAGANQAHDYVWLLKADQPDDVKFLTVENGDDAVGASRFAYGSVTDLTFSFSATAMDISGTMIGRRLAEEGVVTNDSPTKIACIPISADEDNHYVATTIGGLSGGLLGRLFDGNIVLGGRRKPLFPKRRDDKSFTALVETPNKCTVHIEVEQDSDSDAMMRQLRNAARRYYQFHAAGPNIGDGTNGTYEFEVTMPFNVTNPDRGDKDDVYGGMYDLEAVDDATLGGFLKIRIRSALPASTWAAGTDVASGQEPEALIAAAG